MDSSLPAAPPRGRHEMLDEAIDLVEQARADGVDVRLVGGLAVLMLCTAGDACRRDHRDIDLVAPRAAARRLLTTFGGLGYEENRHVRLASGGALIQVFRPCAHRGPRGPLHADDRVDVYLDAFRLHHTIWLRRRLRSEPFTLPPSDVLLAKLLRTRMTDTDVRDVVTLLLAVEVQEEEAPGIIGSRYLARAGAREWGLYHDVTANLAGVSAAGEGLGLGDGEAERVRTAATRILAAMAAVHKGPRWRLRAVIGERLPWYDAVDEDDGQRIGLLERPATAAGPAGSSAGA